MNSENNKQSKVKNTIEVCEPDKEQRKRYLLSLPDDRFEEVCQCDGANKYYGFRDKETGEMLIACQYYFCWSFYNGLARVERSGKCGFIDKTGQEVVPLIYNKVWFFHDGLALVQKSGKYGFIDRTAQEVVPLIYDEIGFFSDDGLARVERSGKCGFIDKTGQEVVPLIYDEAGDFYNGEAKVMKAGEECHIDMAGNEF